MGGNDAAIRAELRTAARIAFLFARWAVAVRCVRVELLPLSNDRGAVGKSSAGGLYGGASLGIAFRTARDDETDRSAASGAPVALRKNHGSFARGAVVEDTGGAHLGRNVQREKRSPRALHAYAEAALGRREEHGDDSFVYVHPAVLREAGREVCRRCRTRLRAGCFARKDGDLACGKC